ncbi:MAG TPA: hypothetical protein VF101_06535 [Gaiellaceae bacterium]
MTQETHVSDADSASGYVQFWTAGESVKGEFHCAECGYGVAIFRVLPRCPMCGGETWEQVPWSPFGRAGAPLR